MALEITLAQFSKIASGDYTAGQIDILTNKQGAAELVKVNNHVWKTGENKVILSPERILEVKEAFLNALQKAGVSAEKMAEIRDRLGIPSKLILPESAAQRDSILQARFTPLTRAQAREIIDTYANYGKGFTEASKRGITLEIYEAGYNTRNMSASNIRTRDRANMVSMARHQSQSATGASYGVANYSITDALSLLSPDVRMITDLVAAQKRRPHGALDDTVRDQMLKASFENLFAQALKMLPAGVRESGEFRPDSRRRFARRTPASPEIQLARPHRRGKGRGGHHPLRRHGQDVEGPCRQDCGGCACCGRGLVCTDARRLHASLATICDSCNLLPRRV